jgi:hypothetical protein
MASEGVEMRELLDDEGDGVDINDISLDEAEIGDDALYSFATSADSSSRARYGLLLLLLQSLGLLTPVSCSGWIGWKGVLAVVVVSCILVVGIVSVGEVARYLKAQPSSTPSSTEQQQQQQQQREAWQQLSLSVATAKNESADACTDFYEYVCGSWMRDTAIPSNRASITKSFSSIQEANKAILEQIVQGDWPLIGPLYDSCMDVSTIESRGIEPLQAYVCCCCCYYYYYYCCWQQYVLILSCLADGWN